jgi:hypothetical protein
MVGPETDAAEKLVTRVITFTFIPRIVLLRDGFVSIRLPRNGGIAAVFVDECDTLCVAVTRPGAVGSWHDGPLVILTFVPAEDGRASGSDVEGTFFSLLPTRYGYFYVFQRFDL